MGQFWSKLDAGLATVYANYLEIERKGKDNVGWVHPGLQRKVTGAHVRLRFEGPLADIERAGFETTWVRDDKRVASGIVRFATLEAVASVPGVIRLSYGREGQPAINRSIPFVRADHVRQYSPVSETYTGLTGRNVLIAVIDTGLDYTHDFLQEPAADDEPQETRIVRIWDQGLVPVSGEHSPDSALLGGRPTYGVEYTEDDINDTLADDTSGGVRVRHRDCNGHGTHVASIAMGTGGRARTYVGMAPRAKLIGVKILYLENEPRQGAAVISYRQRFADAVDYVFNVAATPELGNPRVVINYSVGSNLGPHDGMSEMEEDLNHALNADPRRIFVTSAGNEGGEGQRGRITAPASLPTISIPCLLSDTRNESKMTSYNHCAVRATAGEVELELWYKAPSPAPVTGTLEIDGVDDPIDLPPLGSHTNAVDFGQGQTYRLAHEQELAEDGAIRLLRNVIRLTITPAANRYQASRDLGYMLFLDVTAGQVFNFFGGSSAHGLVRFHTDEENGLTDDYERTSEIGRPAGAASVIAVGNFMIPTEDDTGGTSSSHGPLVSYNPAWTPPQKPDVGAPGEDITAARSRFATQPGCCVSLPHHDATIVKSGTSMASPHVAGLVALMLEKNPNLTLSDVRDNLRFLARTVDRNVLGAGIIDAEATLAATPEP
jgi:subtilisin family serine protease